MSLRISRLLPTVNSGLGRSSQQKAFAPYRKLRHELLEDRRVLATFVVNVDSDAVDINGDPIENDGNLTLRDAIAYINQTATPTGLELSQISGLIGQNDHVVFDGGLFNADNELVIDLAHISKQDAGSALALLDAIDDVTIDAGTGRRVTLSASNVGSDVRVMRSQSENVTLRNLTLTGGHASSIADDGHGGGLFATKTITLEDVWAIGNTADRHGGGIAVNFQDDFELTISGGLFQGNHADENGGGIALLVGADDMDYDLQDMQMLIHGVVVGGADASTQGNTADNGAGIYIEDPDEGFFDKDAFGIIAIRDSVVRGNRAGSEQIGTSETDGLFQLPQGRGGGIHATATNGRLLIDGVSIFENSAPRKYLNGKEGDDGTPGSGFSGFGYGGGVFIKDAAAPVGEDYAVEIVNSTIAENEALSGGGIYLGAGGHSTLAHTAFYATIIRHSTITENTAGPSSDSDRVASWGGGILIEAFDWDEFDPSHSYPLNPAPGPLTNPLFLDHTVVSDNHHFPNTDIPTGTGFQDLTIDEVNPLQYSPNIGYNDETRSDAQGYLNRPGGVPGELDPPNQPYERLNTSFTYLQLDAPDGDPYPEVLAPFNQVLQLWDINANASEVYLSEGELLGRNLYDFAYGQDALSYVPLRGGVLHNAGDATYTQVSNQPQYMLPVGSYSLLVASGVDEIEHDQREDPYDRVVQTVELGAWELQDPPYPPPSERPIYVTDVILDGTGWARASHSYADAFAADTDGVGDQLKPFFTDGVDTISIEFSEAPLIEAGALELIGSNGVVFDSSHYSTPVVSGLTATWTFNSLPSGLTSLPSDKYRIVLTDNKVRNAENEILDGEWINDPGEMLVTDPGTGISTAEKTWDDFTDDPARTALESGNGIPGVSFVFMFSLLAGDTDQNGHVDSSDSSLGGDVDGDGDADATDVSLIDNTHLGETLAAHGNSYYPGTFPITDYENLGDYNEDEQVTIEDYRIWRFTYGGLNDRRADGNSDDSIDAADYTAYRDNLGDYSGWYLGVPPGQQTSGAQVIWGVGPQVTDVIIHGSASTHLPYSYDTVDGSGDQLLTAPVGGADSISIRFTEDVNVMASDLKLVGLRTANRPMLAEFSYEIDSMTATWRFEGWSLGDQYAIVLADSVTDIEGNPLDGEWTNPQSIGQTHASISEFPSGDGTAGGNFVFVATLLPGDANLDGTVNGTDFDILSAYYGTQMGARFTHGDNDGDGDVDYSDFVVANTTWGTDLTQPLTILSDLDGDLDVDDDDADLLFANYMQGISSPTENDGDLDGDGDIDVYDYDILYEQIGLSITVAV